MEDKGDYSDMVTKCLPPELADDILTEIEKGKIKPAKKYTYAEKKKIVHKVSKIRSKKNGVAIYAIIANDTKKFSENSNGMFVIANDLNDKTFERLEKYIKYLVAQHKEKKLFKQSPTAEAAQSEASEQNLESTEDVVEEEEETSIDTLRPTTVYSETTAPLSVMRLSQKEKTILKKLRGTAK